MKKRNRRQSPQAPFRKQQDGAAAREREVNFAGILENGLIFVALLIAISAALYILNSQLIRLI